MADSYPPLPPEPQPDPQGPGGTRPPYSIAAGTLPPPPPPRSLASKLLGLFLVIICFEIGVFLMVFPWVDAWGQSTIPSWSITLLDLWENNYFRGALSGLGLVNVWISFAEMVRLLRG